MSVQIQVANATVFRKERGKKIGTDTHFLKNLIKLKLMLNSYFKLNPDKEEKITDVLSHTCPSD